MPTTSFLQALSDNIVIDKDKCVYCGTCVDTCILDNLRMKLSPCRQGCPMQVNAQGYVQEISRGKEDNARKIVREKLFMPEVLGRICPAPCENMCHHKVMDGQAVSIRALKRYLFEGQKQEDIPIPEINSPTGKKIAIVGAGPAGLQAAYDLKVLGHGVEVFDSSSQPGGMLRWGIPEFRLPTEILEKELTLLVKMGVEFRCGVKIGEDLSLEDLQKSHDSVILATGCPQALELGIADENVKGVYSGLNLLSDARNNTPPALKGHTVVIGGGNVAVDAAQVALRLGAEKVTLVSLESEEELPAFAQEVAEAKQEGVIFHPTWGVSRFTTVDNRLTGLELKRCVSLFDDKGNFNPKYDKSQLEILAADSVIVAIGQHRNNHLFENLTDIDDLSFQNGESNLFVAGDCLTGPSSVISAMASGHNAAESAKRYLAEEDMYFGRTYEGPVETDFEINTKRGSDEKRALLGRRAFSGKGDFSEVELPLEKDQARKEAGRCYSCGEPFGKFRSCWFCLPCEVECPEEALKVEIPFLLR